MSHARAIARELLESDDFNNLGAVHVDQLVELLYSPRDIKLHGSRKVKKDLRDALSDIRSEAARLDIDDGGRLVLLTQKYFNLSQRDLENITESNAGEMIALNGRRAVGIMFCDPSILQHKFLFRAYRKMMMKNIKGCLINEEKVTVANQGMLTPGHKKKALQFLGAFNNFNEMGAALLGSGK